MNRMIAALFVETNGCYFGMPSVDPWDEQRDARYGAPTSLDGYAKMLSAAMMK